MIWPVPSSSQTELPVGPAALLLRGIRVAHPSYTCERLTGVWRSLVARVVRDDEAAGSNPVTPTNVKSRSFTGRLFTLFAGVRGSRRFETLPGQRTALTGCNVEPCGAPRPHPRFDTSTALTTQRTKRPRFDTSTTLTTQRAKPCTPISGLVRRVGAPHNARSVRHGSHRF